MRDAVSLLQKPITIQEEVYKIIDFYHVPGNTDVYIKLKNKKGDFLNYAYKELQETLEKQLQL